MTVVLDRTKVETGAARPAEKATALPRSKPIIVNGVTIARDAIARETQNHPAGKPVDAWLAAARALVVRELLLQEARRLGIAPAPQTDDEGRRELDEEALVRQLVEREVHIPVADDDACRRIYEQRRAAFRSSDLFEVRHILLAAAPDDLPARDKARTEAQSLIAALASAPERFAEFAEACSACPSLSQGGALGQVSRGQTVPEFEAALREAPLGAVAPEPVETRYGFHVIVIDQRLGGEPLPYELVKPQIAAWLSERAQTTAIRQYIAMLAGRAEICGIDLNGQAPQSSRQSG